MREGCSTIPGEGDGPFFSDQICRCSRCFWRFILPVVWKIVIPGIFALFRLVYGSGFLGVSSSLLGFPCVCRVSWSSWRCRSARNLLSPGVGFLVLRSFRLHEFEFCRGGRDGGKGWEGSRGGQDDGEQGQEEGRLAFVPCWSTGERSGKPYLSLILNSRQSFLSGWS